MVLYGDKGIGKTSFIKHIIHELEKQKIDNDVSSESENIEGPNFIVKYFKVPNKIITKEKLRNFVEDCFDVIKEENIEESEIQKLDNQKFDIRRLDKKIPKTVIFLDESQNFFLAKSGGFEAYHDLIDLVNLDTDNIYWVFSFNFYSWIYLDRAFGRKQFFRHVFHLKGWPDDKIKELIQKRHKESKYRLSFDSLITATKAEEEVDRYASIEAKFYKLLWELSSGNPRSALFLWLSALRAKGENDLHVNIPKLPSLDIMGDLTDETLFALAKILMHENLTNRELVDTSNLPSGLIRNALKVGLEKDLLFKDNRNRYLLSSIHQYNVIRFLKSKNFIYGV
jgi:GTPase SAR1 family protein